MITKEERIQQRRKEDIEFINDPYGWPVYPFLPMKRTGPDHSNVSGVIINPERTVVYEKNMFSFESGELLPQLKDAKKHQYESVEALVADGWMVD